VNTCGPCDPGKFQKEEAKTKCEECPPGKWSPSNQDKCDPCPDGEVPSGTASKCERCHAGQAAPAGSASCTDCTPDTYATACVQADFGYTFKASTPISPPHLENKGFKLSPPHRAYREYIYIYREYFGKVPNPPKAAKTSIFYMIWPYGQIRRMENVPMDISRWQF